MRLYPDICHPIARCQRYDASGVPCGRPAYAALVDESRDLIVFTPYCRRHALRIVRELRLKLGERWHWVRVVEPEGCSVPFGAVISSGWPGPVGARGGKEFHQGSLQPGRS